MLDEILTDIPADGEPFKMFSDPENKSEESKPAEKKDEQQGEAAESSTETSKTEPAPSQEGADDDGDETKDDSKEKSDESSNSEETSASNTSDESNVPFNKHPRWKELQDQLTQLRTDNAELKQNLGSLAPALEALTQQKKEAQVEQIPEWFAALYGSDNQDAWKNYRADLDAKISSVKQEIRAEIEAERTQKQQESDRWNTWMKDSITKVQTQYDVKLPEGSTERNEFLKYVLKYKPTDNEGNIDFILGYELYSQIKEVERSKKSEKNNARKQIAAQTTSQGKEPKTEYVASPKTLRNKSFLDLALESLNE